MKKTLFILTLLVFIAVSSCKKPAELDDLSASITQDELKEMLYTYASDEYEGRMTGEPGQKKAVEFLKSHYEAMKIPSAIEGNYFQEVPLEIIKTPDVYFSINETQYSYYDDFISYSNAPLGKIEATEVVYLGYGIQHERYNDYENVDVKGKVVIVQGGEPKDKAGNYIISGSKEISKWSNGRQALASKKEAAKENGAKALIFIDNPTFITYSEYFKKQEIHGGSSRLSLPDSENDIYMFLGNEKIGNNLVDDFKSLEHKTYTTDLKIRYEPKKESITSENVVAYIKGAEKPEEYIVISAHLDHVGVNEKGEVYNGADDDGSGTVAILEIAEAFKQAADNGKRPKRSIVFLHVTGEERGLLGSKYYTDYNPIFPLENTVANLNIDMIGRVDPKRDSSNRNYLYLIGSDKLSTELHELSEEVNEKYTGIEFDYTYNDDNDPNRFYYRSDHYNFAKNNIPVIFYFNGTHDDYHQVTDTADKIEYDLLENRTKLIFYTAWELANREQRIKVDKAE